MIMAIYVGVLNLDKVSTLKPNIANNQYEKDLSVLTCKRSNRCRPKYFYSPNPSIRKTTLVIPVIIKRKVPHHFFSLLDQKFLNTTLFNILFIQFNPSCQYHIQQFLLDQLLGENFNNRKYFLLILLIFFVPNSDLINYLSILSTYNVPIISRSNTELNMRRYHYNNFLSYKTREYTVVKFLLLFVTKVNVNSLIILYDSDQNSLELMLNLQEKLNERDSTICQFYTYSISKSKLNNSTILEKIQINKFVKYVLIISRHRALISLIIGVLRSSKVMKTVILHDLAESAYELKEDKLDLIFINYSYNLVTRHIAQALAKAVKKHQLNLNSASTTNITGRIIPKRFLDSFTSSLDVQVPRIKSLSMYHQWIQGVVKVARYGKYRDRRSQATAEWLTSNITLTSGFCQKNCSPGHYPIYTGLSRCCWVCMFCENKYFKKAEGQGECIKCDEKTSLTSKNRTICVPFAYDYYQIVVKDTNIAFILAIIGALYTTIILFIFVKYRKTPVVKSSNFPLSLIQIVFHAMQSLQLLISTLKQTQAVCIFNAVTTGSIIKLFILIHLVKTNQLLTVFQSTTRVKRKYFAKTNEVAVPGVFIAANTLLNIIYLVGTALKFGVFEKRKNICV